MLRYSRYGNNPNQESVAAKVAALEGTEAALALASGMAATAMTLLAVTQAGDHVVASRYLYGATQLLLADELPTNPTLKVSSCLPTPRSRYSRSAPPSAPHRKRGRSSPPT